MYLFSVDDISHGIKEAGHTCSSQVYVSVSVGKPYHDYYQQITPYSPS